MASITLNDGAKLPVLAFGTGTNLFNKDAEIQVKQAIDAGFVHIDCASFYGNEESVGQAIKGIPREKLFITTKVGNKDPRASLEDSLKALGLDYVDLFLIHTPIGTPPKENWPIMEALQAEGKTKSIGVSNFRTQDLEELFKVSKVVPAINQIEVHPYCINSILPLLDLMKKHNIHAACYGPLTSLFREKGGPVDTLVKEYAEKRGVSEGNVLLRWALQRTGGEIVTTSNKPERLQEILRVPEIEPLTEEEIKSIEEAGKDKHFRVFMKHMDE
ncbi:Aldo/keto reductase family proteins [Phaffia rhodozyma]|uniref:Aldo/keto reductase family proteins n=1 Tax=Phaffia rhodozyma TaxID=264483 RepID=A0A0F7SJ59_PHARH|nr:Aldo/keto reductase family proteins [Phaffia rhodozyma]